MSEHSQDFLEGYRVGLDHGERDKASWWTPAPFVVLSDPRLTGNALRVLLILASYANAQGACWPSRETLAEKTCLSLRSVDQAIVQLAELSLIQVTKRQVAKRGKTSNLYTVADLREVANTTLRYEQSQQSRDEQNLHVAENQDEQNLHVATPGDEQNLHVGRKTHISSDEQNLQVAELCDVQNTTREAKTQQPRDVQSLQVGQNRCAKNDQTDVQNLHPNKTQLTKPTPPQSPPMADDLPGGEDVRGEGDFDLGFVGGSAERPSGQDASSQTAALPEPDQGRAASQAAGDAHGDPEDAQDDDWPGAGPDWPSDHPWDEELDDAPDIEPGEDPWPMDPSGLPYPSREAARLAEEQAAAQEAAQAVTPQAPEPAPEPKPAPTPPTAPDTRPAAPSVRQPEPEPQTPAVSQPQATQGATQAQPMQPSQADAVRSRVAFDAPHAATWLNPGQVDEWLAQGIDPGVIARAVLASTMLPKAVSWRAFNTAVTNSARIAEQEAFSPRAGSSAPAGGKPDAHYTIQALVDAAWELDDIPMAGYLAKGRIEEGQIIFESNAASLWRSRVRDNLRQLYAIAHHAGVDLAENPVR